MFDLSDRSHLSDVFGLKVYMFNHLNTLICLVEKIMTQSVSQWVREGSQKKKYKIVVFDHKGGGGQPKPNPYSKI